MNTAVEPKAVVSNFGIATSDAAKATTAYVFFAGNMVSPTVKLRVPAWSAGGVLRPNSLTLRYRHGFIRQCEITQMRQYMDGQWAALVEPNARQYMPSSYRIQEDGEEIRVGGRGYDNHLLFRAFFPEDELDRLTGQGDGLVKFPVSSPHEAIEAQYFLFEDWDAIAAGYKQLPTTIRALKEHFQSRLQEALRLQNQRLVAYAEAAILSCDQFEVAGREEIARANEEMTVAEKRGWPYSYGADAILYFEQLDIPRPDRVSEAQNDRMSKLETGLLEYARITANALAGRAAEVPVAPLDVQPPSTTESQAVVPEAAPVAEWSPQLTDIVQYQDQPAVISLIQGGKITIEFTDGSTKRVKKEELALLSRP